MFKVFDKENTGEIHINQVYDLISKFEDTTLLDKGTQNKDKNKRNKEGTSRAGG